jgi:hypothetical protein
MLVIARALPSSLFRALRSPSAANSALNSRIKSPRTLRDPL